MKKLNWAILGPGSIAREFAEALNRMDIGVYAVGSRTLEKAKEFAEEYNAEKYYGNYFEMLKDENIDIVYISTPHSHHHEYIIESLKNNKHVLCEKAITVNNAQLKEVVNLVKEKNLIVSEAMTIYHMPLYKELDKLINSGKIGKINMMQVSFGSYKEYDVKNRFFNKELAGGALLDIGTYALSFARFFMSSQPEQVLTTMKKFETGVDEQSGIILRNSNDEMAVINLTMRTKMPKRGIIGGEKGFIIIDNFPRAESAVILYTDGTQETVSFGETAKALEYEVEDMIESIHNKNDSTLALSIDVMELINNIQNNWEK